MLFIILLFLTNFSYAVSEYLYGSFGESAMNYLSEIERRNDSAFLSQCKYNNSTYEYYKATLIFEVSSKKGILIETNKKYVINMTNITIEDNGPIFEETHGGTYSYRRVENLINELVRYKFRLMTPFRVVDFINAMPRDKCINRP